MHSNPSYLENGYQKIRGSIFIDTFLFILHFIKQRVPRYFLCFFCYDQGAYNEEKKSWYLNFFDFVIAPSDDVWIRDTGPIFVKDEKGQLAIMNFAFDGWGKKMPYTKDNQIPQSVSKQKKTSPSSMSHIWLWKADQWRSARMEH